jgi:hypothetical protein
VLPHVAVNAHLSKDQPVPKWMNVDPGSMQLLQFGRHRLSENDTTEVRDISSKHCALINFV